MRPTEKTRARDRPTDRANERIVNKWQHIHWQCTQAKTGRNNSDKEAAHNSDIERKRKLQQLQMKSEQRKIMKKRREREKKHQMRSREWISSKYKRQFFFLSVYCFESLCHFFSSLLGICVYVRFFFSLIVVAVVVVVAVIVIVCLFRIELSNAAAGTFLCVDTCVLA